MPQKPPNLDTSKKIVVYKDFGIYPTRTSLVACWWASLRYSWDPNKGFGEQYLWRKDSALRLYCRCIACLVNVFVLCNISTTAIFFFPPHPQIIWNKQLIEKSRKWNILLFYDMYWLNMHCLLPQMWKGCILSILFFLYTDTMPTCTATRQGWWQTQSWATGTSTRASRPQRPEDWCL